MPTAGSLRDRVRLEQQALDDNNDHNGPWNSEGAPVRSCEIIYLHGTEAVQQQRLQGVQPVVIKVRADSVTKLVDNTWRAVDARSARIYDIQAATLSPGRDFIEILAVWNGKQG